MTGATGSAGRELIVGIDARAAAEVQAGRGRLVREMLRALARRDNPYRYRCYTRLVWEESLDERFTWIPIRASDALWHSRVAVAARTCDVFLASNSYLTAILSPTPTVTTVYDLVTFDPSMRPNLRSAVIERLTLGLAVSRSRALWCISQATRDELVQRFPSAAPKAVAIPLAVAPTLLAPSAAEAAELPAAGFVLVVGTLEPRKNLPRLVAAYSALPAELQQAHPLVVVGAHGWQTAETVEALTSLGSRCRTLGRVSDAALAELYRRCAVFCYPSLGEGFGLPVLEAMAAGAAVITSGVSSLPEVGGDAVVYIDPYSVESITGAFELVLTSPERRAELARRAVCRAAVFSWERTAEGVTNLFEEAAGRAS